jgi:hypothetical protein
MKQDMVRMKQQAMEFAMKAQAVTEQAKREREESAVQLQALNEQLVMARSQVSSGWWLGVR